MRVTEADAKTFTISSGPTTPRSTGNSLSEFAQQSATRENLPVLSVDGLPKWQGTVVELAEKTESDRLALPVHFRPTQNAAFQLAAQSYLQRSGKRITAASLRNSWNQAQKKRDGNI